LGGRGCFWKVSIYFVGDCSFEQLAPDDYQKKMRTEVEILGKSRE
jgi:hypothetical protein